MFQESHDLSLYSKFFKQNLLLDTLSQWEFHLDVENTLELRKKNKKK